MERLLMTNETTHDVEMVALVNRYATPFAILLVSLGIIVTQPASPVRELCVALLFAGILFNLAVVAYLRGHPGSVRPVVRTRLVVNFALNLALVRYLGGYWTPIWLLMALTPIASAIYGSRRDAYLASGAVCAALLLVRGLRGASSPLDWGEQAAYCAFVVLASLLVNELAASARGQARSQ